MKLILAIPILFFTFIIVYLSLNIIRLLLERRKMAAFDYKLRADDISGIILYSIVALTMLVGCGITMWTLCHV